MQKIIVVDSDPSWPLLFEEEKVALQRLLPPTVIIEHIGSTAVANLAAKPVIDIMIGVPSLQLADQHYLELIKSLGYTYVPEYEAQTPDRRYFRKKNDGIATHHIHLVEHNGPWWKRHIQFRNYLRAHPRAVQEYGDLKKNLAPKFSDTNEYAKAKTEFIKKIEALAEKQEESSRT